MKDWRTQIGKAQTFTIISENEANLRIWADDRLVERSSEHRNLAPWMAHNERKELKDEPGNLPP